MVCAGSISQCHAEIIHALQLPGITLARSKRNCDSLLGPGIGWRSCAEPPFRPWIKETGLQSRRLELTGYMSKVSGRRMAFRALGLKVRAAGLRIPSNDVQ